MRRAFEVRISDLQIVRGRDGFGVAEPRAVDMRREVSANSVCRDERRLWKSRGHRFSPARSTIRSNCCLRLQFRQPFGPVADFRIFSSTT